MSLFNLPPPRPALKKYALNVYTSKISHNCPHYIDLIDTQNELKIFRKNINHLIEQISINFKLFQKLCVFTIRIVFFPFCVLLIEILSEPKPRKRLKAKNYGKKEETERKTRCNHPNDRDGVNLMKSYLKYREIDIHIFSGECDVLYTDDKNLTNKQTIK